MLLTESHEQAVEKVRPHPKQVFGIVDVVTADPTASKRSGGGDTRPGVWVLVVQLPVVGGDQTDSCFAGITTKFLSAKYSAHHVRTIKPWRCTTRLHFLPRLSRLSQALTVVVSMSRFVTDRDCSLFVYLEVSSQTLISATNNQRSWIVTKQGLNSKHSGSDRSQA